MSLLHDLSKDRRVVVYAAAVVLALIFIAVFGLKFGLDLEGGSYLQLQLQGAVAQVDVSPEKILEAQFHGTSVEKHGDSYFVTVQGKVDSTLADDLGYSGAKIVERDNTSKVTIIAAPETVITNYLKKSLDADVKIVGVAPVKYEIRTNVSRDSLNAILAPVGGSVPSGEDAFVEGVTADTVDETKKVLDSKLNRLGLQDIKVRIVDNKFILIDLAGMDVATAQDVVGKPGKFEIRIQTENNQTVHVLYGDAVESVDIPQGDRQGGWGVPFMLSEEGAKVFQKAAIDAGATKDPDAHYISMYLDKDEIFSAPLAAELAGSLAKSPVRNLEARVGSGDAGSQKAKELYIHLREGALPVNVEIVGSGQVSAALGKQFKVQMVIAGLIALLAVAGMIFYRYREKRVVLPMITTSLSEVVMMLGIWSLAGWQLDLASLAGIIMVIGTGVDQLVIITDELIRGGEASALERSIKERAAEAAAKAGTAIAPTSSKVYLGRLSRAFSIILGAAATTVVAMLPLLYMGFGALTGFALIIILGVFLGVAIARPAYGRIIGHILGTS
ncbi:MAG: Protein-export membrane protein SecD [Methanosaeta sp. PtaB.Bin018]|nr:preprotein translocase subunit SecD [Methanothrix sp.]OPX76359.1 MAG: Protein-export membrane protein SecD [Methanosaeta sp. PtaB.Bin018]OPY47211.1 MAG: Protein-export membrane protein SecD [Methanosaeta sp. PtaU1.Bin016]